MVQQRGASTEPLPVPDSDRISASGVACRFLTAKDRRTVRCHFPLRQRAGLAKRKPGKAPLPRTPSLAHPLQEIDVSKTNL